MTLAENAFALADRLITKFGVVATWVEVDATNDPSQGTVMATETEHTIKVAPPRAVSAFWVDGELVQAGDLMTSFAAKGLAFTPAVGHKLQLGSITFRVIRVEEVPVGTDEDGANVTALWRAFLRR